jgi:hypothetical protein
MRLVNHSIADVIDELITDYKYGVVALLASAACRHKRGSTGTGRRGRGCGRNAACRCCHRRHLIS